MSESSVSRGSTATLKPTPLRRGKSSGDVERNCCCNLLSVICAFIILYAFYTGFFLFWLEMLDQYGNALLWFYFGMGCSTFGGMICFTMYSMSYQEVGWFAPKRQLRVAERTGICLGIKWF